MVRIPDEATIAEAKRFILEQSVEDVGGLVKLGRFLRVRFVYSQNGLPDVPDDMLMRDFRTLANRGKASIIIDDEGGGSSVRPRTPELII